MEEESEVRMAALQQSTKDSERIIVESQAEKLRYMDEAHQAARRIAHLEAKYVCELLMRLRKQINFVKWILGTKLLNNLKNGGIFR